MPGVREDRVVERAHALHDGRELGGGHLRDDRGGHASRVPSADGPTPRRSHARRRSRETAPGRVSGRAHRARPRQRVPVARRDDPLGADHRRAREHGDAGAVREVPDARRPGPRGSGRCRAHHPVDGVLPFEDQEHHRDGAGARGALRRRGPVRARRLRDAARCRTQDRQRRAVGVVRPPRAGGRHARDAARVPAEAHQRDRPGEDRARPERHRRARGAGQVLAPADRARPQGVRRQASALRRLRAQRHLPIGIPRRVLGDEGDGGGEGEGEGDA